jgi:L-threonine kinase
MPFDFSPITVTVAGTCGELVQGWSAPWAEPVLVSCPIACYSRVTCQLTSRGVIEAPPHHEKAQRAARLLLDRLAQPEIGLKIEISSDLIPARGMASSTADVVGVLTGLGLALGRRLGPAQLARLACRIEPSDSTMFNGLALLAYRGSARWRRLGSVPALPLLLLDPGQALDTVAYNARLDLARVRALAATTQAALDLLQAGLKQGDPALIGAAASLSAHSYQAINDNPLVIAAQGWASATGGLGVIRAHSGTIVGLLYGPGAELTGPAAWLAGRFTGLIRPTSLTNETCRVTQPATSWG